jgi:hypothetical protein
MAHPDRASRLRIVVLGYIVRGPLGGFAWHHLQYVTGLAKLGHEVLFVEDSGDYPACYDPVAGVTGTDPSYGLAFTRDAFDGIGMGESWAYYDSHRRQWHGPCADSALGRCASADLLVNLCDAEPLRPWLAGIPVRALVDTDPAFSQVRHLGNPEAAEAARCHTAFFSFGENIASGAASVPADGLPWQATRQPIDFDVWPVTTGDRSASWTTIMQWDSYPAVEHDGIAYAMKSASFGPYADLPARVGRVFELALGSPGAPRAELEARGWRLCDPRDPSRTPWSYRRYLQASKGEFTVAKHGYVVSQSGWFSERSACYLASGRPVVTQDTGFTLVLETGEGLVAFTTPDEAQAGLEDVDRRYDHHCAAAYELARERFAARDVLASLVERAMTHRAKEAALA